MLQWATHVLRLLVKAIWKCCNGCKAKAVPGMSKHVLMLMKKAIWRSCNGPKAKAVPVSKMFESGRMCKLLRVEAILRK